MGNNPSHFKGDDLPVDSVTWAEAISYCKAIGGRLPTEREWEYAARAGTTGSRYGPLDDVAWYAGNGDKATHTGGLKRPNAFALYDMLGNVWEWTASNYDAAGKLKVARGGSWADFAWSVRVSMRDRVELPLRNGNLGFRCVGEFR
jgi:formylglycine-generating enzyme